jgi:hypothetical protein
MFLAMVYSGAATKKTQKQHIHLLPDILRPATTSSSSDCI